MDNEEMKITRLVHTSTRESNPADVVRSTRPSVFFGGGSSRMPPYNLVELSRRPPTTQSADTDEENRRTTVNKLRRKEAQ